MGIASALPDTEDDATTTYEWFNVRARVVGCPGCHAEPGQPCRTNTGRKAKRSCGERFDALLERPELFRDDLLVRCFLR